MSFVEILEHHLLDHVHAELVTLGGITFSFTKHMSMMILAMVILIVVFYFATRPGKNGRMNPIANALEAFIIYIRDEIVRPNLGPSGDQYLGYFLTLFFFILTCNLIGLVPFGSTATGNISVTLGLALVTFAMINIGGIREHGVIHYLQTFIPHGLPFWLVPLMFVIEVLGLFTKSFALCIRLFANMIAGHIVILAFISLIFIFKTIFIAPVSVGAAVGLGMLELFVALLQAYVFTLLTAVFVGGAVNPQH